MVPKGSFTKTARARWLPGVQLRGRRACTEFQCDVVRVCLAEGRRELYSAGLPLLAVAPALAHPLNTTCRTLVNSSLLKTLFSKVRTLCRARQTKSPKGCRKKPRPLV